MTKFAGLMSCKFWKLDFNKDGIKKTYPVDVAHFVQTFDRSQRFYCTVEAGIFAEKAKIRIFNIKVKIVTWTPCLVDAFWVRPVTRPEETWRWTCCAAQWCIDRRESGNIFAILFHCLPSSEPEKKTNFSTENFPPFFYLRFHEELEVISIGLPLFVLECVILSDVDCLDLSVVGCLALSVVDCLDFVHCPISAASNPFDDDVTAIVPEKFGKLDWLKIVNFK